MEMPFLREIPARTLLLLLGTGLAASGCASWHRKPAAEDGGPAPGEQEMAQTVEPPDLEPARVLLEAGDPNAALNRLDELQVAAASDPAFWLLYGEANLRFALDGIASGQAGGLQIQGLLADAGRAYQRAAELAPASPDPWIGLLRTRRAAGDATGAWQAGEEAFTRLAPGEDRPDFFEEWGRAGLDLVIQAVQAGEPLPAAADRAAEALERARAPGRRGAAVPLSDLPAWSGRRDGALRVLEEALQETPEDLELLGRLQNLTAEDPAARVRILETLRARWPAAGTPLWYLGAALYHLHQEARTRGDSVAAYEALDRAEEAFQRARALRPDYEATCRQWLHLVRTQRGWTLREEGRVEDAAQAFLHALEADPEMLEPEAEPGSLNLGIYAVTDDFFREGRLKDVRGFLSRVAALHQGNADWLNNLGFACRELGVAAQQAGNQEEAARLFQESWEAYTLCVRARPDDPRFVNDRALIAVYYLGPETWEEAEAELHRAIRLGEEALASLPADVTEEERKTLEEAVGDAWENLAWLDVMRRRRLDRAEDYLEQSVKYYPGADRQGVARLRLEIQRRRQAEAADPGSQG